MADTLQLPFNSMKGSSMTKRSIYASSAVVLLTTAMSWGMAHAAGTGIKPVDQQANAPTPSAVAGPQAHEAAKTTAQPTAAQSATHSATQPAATAAEQAQMPAETGQDDRQQATKDAASNAAKGAASGALGPK